MPEWLDLELSHRLAPTEAPDELWTRVCLAQAGQIAVARRRSPVFALPVAAVVTLVLAGALYFIAKGQPNPVPYRSNNPVAECVACHT